MSSPQNRSVPEDLQDMHRSLTGSAQFKNWLKTHPQSYLSHFFSQVSSQLKQKSSWEIGYYNPEHQKITIFVPVETEPTFNNPSSAGKRLAENTEFIIKSEDDVFQEKTSVVEQLKFAAVVKSFPEAADVAQKNISQLFPQEILGDGFVVLQTFSGKTQWNFSFVTQSLKFANIKINSVSGEIDSHQLVEAVRRDK